MKLEYYKLQFGSQVAPEFFSTIEEDFDLRIMPYIVNGVAWQTNKGVNIRCQQLCLLLNKIKKKHNINMYLINFGATFPEDDIARVNCIL